MKRDKKTKIRAQKELKVDEFSSLNCPSVTAILPNPSFHRGESFLDKLLENSEKLEKLRNNQSNMMVLPECETISTRSEILTMMMFSQVYNEQKS